MKKAIAAPDKFRGTASGKEVANAIATGIKSATSSWETTEVPMADGGEGTLDVVGGLQKTTTVKGPLGQETVAQWRLLGSKQLGKASESPTAVIEMAQASGRALLRHPSGDDPILASTRGVGTLIIAAIEHGAKRIIVAVGGSASTDGGQGAVETLVSHFGSIDRTVRELGNRGLEVACDVRTSFLDAAFVFGPQKGATHKQVLQLAKRLVQLAGTYRQDFGVDVTKLVGGGAAGGLAGGLGALGAKLSPGGPMLAQLLGLNGRIQRADLVVTGEGRLDGTSFEGKVVGTVIELAKGQASLLCLAGQVDEDAKATFEGLSSPNFPLTLVDLSERFGKKKAQTTTCALISSVVAGHLQTHFSPGRLP